MSADGLVLALGGGGARGLAHVGVLSALEAAGIPVRAVVGTSIGAEVGAFFAAGVPLKEIRKIVFDWDWLDTLKLFVPAFDEGGVFAAEKVDAFLRPWLGDRRVEDTAVGFAAIATDLHSGEEVVIRNGPLVEAVRASIAFPGLWPPVRWQGRWLADGGITNPVPFDVARRLFGGPVVAVYVHPRPGVKLMHEPKSEALWDRLAGYLDHSWMGRFPWAKEWLGSLLHALGEEEEEEEGHRITDVLLRAQIISEHALVRLRERLMPADLVIEPEIGDIGLLEFYRGEEAFEAGFSATTRMMARIEALLEAREGLWARIRRWWQAS